MAQAHALHYDSCIGVERIAVTELYEYRKKFQTTTAPSTGGARDATRKELENHYDKGSKTFTRSFVVGPLGDCCAASAGLAKGISFHTFADSRVDVHQNRPLHAGPASTLQRFMNSLVTT